MQRIDPELVEGLAEGVHASKTAPIIALHFRRAPRCCRHLFACVCETMIQGIRLLHARQTRGREPRPAAQRFVTVSNCLVNLVSPEVYRELLLPFDQKLAAVYGCIGIHYCAWNATPYLESYARVPGVAYIDMGIDSDLVRARELFPHARRALMQFLRRQRQGLRGGIAVSGLG